MFSATNMAAIDTTNLLVIQYTKAKDWIPADRGLISHGEKLKLILETSAGREKVGALWNGRRTHCLKLLD